MPSNDSDEAGEPATKSESFGLAMLLWCFLATSKFSILKMLNKI